MRRDPVEVQADLLAAAICRLLDWQEYMMKLKEEQRDERFRKAYERRLAKKAGQTTSGTMKAVPGRSQQGKLRF